jgi:hypothetical protein
MDRYVYLLMLLVYGVLLNVAVIVLNRRKRHSETGPVSKTTGN